MKIGVIFLFFSIHCFCQNDSSIRVVNMSENQDKYTINYDLKNSAQLDSVYEEVRICINALNHQLYDFSNNDRITYLSEIVNSVQLYTIDFDENNSFLDYSVLSCKQSEEFNHQFIECIKGINPELMLFDSYLRIFSGRNSFNLLLVIDDAGFIVKLDVY